MRDLCRPVVFNDPVTQIRIAALIVALAGLALVPAAASARLTEIGQATAVNEPSCPTFPCLAVSRTTGYQAKVGPQRGLFTVPRDGRLVAWSISLGKPGTKQTDFFEKNLGGRASAGIAVLRVGKRSKLVARTVATGPVVGLSKFFGRTVQFALPRSIVVHRNEVVALNVPTWAPALAVGLGNDTSWRAARAEGRCRDTQTQSAMGLNELGRFRCLYRTARLTYSATLISTP